MTTTDQHGVVISSTDPTALAHYDQAIDEILHFRPAVLDELAVAVESDPQMPMAQLLQAYLGVMGTEPEDSRRARQTFAAWWAGVDSNQLTFVEAAHADAVQCWLVGDLRGCARRLGG